MIFRKEFFIGQKNFLINSYLKIMVENFRSNWMTILLLLIFFLMCIEIKSEFNVKVIKVNGQCLILSRENLVLEDAI